MSIDIDVSVVVIVNSVFLFDLLIDHVNFLVVKVRQVNELAVRAMHGDGVGGHAASGLTNALRLLVSGL